MEPEVFACLQYSCLILHLFIALIMGIFMRRFFGGAVFFISGLLFKDEGFVSSVKRVLRGLLVPYLLLSVIYVLCSRSFVHSIYSHAVWPYLKDYLLRIIRGDLFWFITCSIVVKYYIHYY